MRAIEFSERECMFFGQTFAASDLATVAVLVLLEGALSVDNALVLGVMASRFHGKQAAKALTFGVIGAFIFRAIAVVLASYLLRWDIIKLLGGLYLIYLCGRHFFSSRRAQAPKPLRAGSFWWSVAGIELTDMAFAVDNILAAVALVGPPPPGSPKNLPHPKLWVILLGGLIGILLTRFAATGCVALVRRFPRLSTAAYLVVLVVAFKLVVEWVLGQNGPDFQDPHQSAFWIFWLALAGCLAVGFVPTTKPNHLVS
jgi:YkoY family integral membrane protein